MYQRIVDKEKREATIALYGVIGQDIPGNQVALDIAAMDGGVDTINILINSDGGSVSEGLSIVSAILSARAYIHAFVNGIAASMAAVIAVSADKVSMQDYAKMMIHNPFFEGKGNDRLSDRERKARDSITDTLRTILSRRGCGKEKIADLMSNETWFSAINETREQAEEQRKWVIDTFIRLGEEKGVVTKENKERMARLATADISLFLEFVQDGKKEEGKTVAQQADAGGQRLSKAISELREKGSQNQKPERNWDWYQKNDPQALAEMERTDPDKFNRLLDEYEQSI